MKVSVFMLTYNHEKFIAQAIDSVLMQEVNFDYEIAIAEDFSSDRTRDIIMEFQQRYPDKIRLFLAERNFNSNSFSVRGRETCQGQYIALLEGDDYWTSPHKLQKQVDFLDTHPDCTICFHNSRQFYEDGSQKDYNNNSPDQKEISTLEDLLSYNFIATGSTMFRRGVIDRYPDWYVNDEVYSGDWPLHILNAQYGNIGYINEVMVATRIHKGGFWNGISKIKQLQGVIKDYKVMRANLAIVRNKVTQVRLSKFYFQLALEYDAQDDSANAKYYAIQSIMESPINPSISKKSLLQLLIKLYAPLLYKLVTNN